jgi:hypothetical protein
MAPIKLKTIYRRLVPKIIRKTIWNIKQYNKTLILKRRMPKLWKPVTDYLLTNYSSAIDKYKHKENIYKTSDYPYPVWVCWLQGENEMPKVVKECYKSLLRNANGHVINLITRENYSKYVSIPEYIMDKIDNEIISKTNFSDILRVFLLYEYGGLWIDSTILVTSPLPEYTGYDLYSIKKDTFSENISQFRWASFLFYTTKENVLFDFLKYFFLEYCKQEEKWIDYCLIDYAIAIAYDNIPSIKKAIDKIPYSNQQIYNLSSELNNSYSSALLEEICKDTCFHKLTYKEEYSKYTKDGQLSFWGFLLCRLYPS